MLILKQHSWLPADDPISSELVADNIALWLTDTLDDFLFPCIQSATCTWMETQNSIAFAISMEE
jgi:hypothetical protein